MARAAIPANAAAAWPMKPAWLSEAPFCRPGALVEVAAAPAVAVSPDTSVVTGALTTTRVVEVSTFPLANVV
jgi:hypothetical protein